MSETLLFSFLHMKFDGFCLLILQINSWSCLSILKLNPRAAAIIRIARCGRSRESKTSLKSLWINTYRGCKARKARDAAARWSSNHLRISIRRGRKARKTRDAAALESSKSLWISLRRGRKAGNQEMRLQSQTHKEIRPDGRIHLIRRFSNQYYFGLRK